MLELRNVSKTYVTKAEKTAALKKMNLQFGACGLIVLTGKSGSGKSTLLNIIGGLDSFDEGEIIIKGKSSDELTGSMWDSYRNTYVGFVFQEFYIIEEFTVGKNIAMALELQGAAKAEINTKVDEILKQVDLEGLRDRMPNAVSGGQKQRIAIARALIKNPEIILCDEPTGNLDSETGHLILAILKKLSETKLVIMVTHDEDFAHEFGDRIIELKDGEVISDQINDDQHADQEIIYEKTGTKQVVKLPKGKALSPKMISYINSLAREHHAKLYLSLSQNKTYIGQFADLTEKPNEPKIIEERLKIEHQEGFQLKKTSLPFNNAAKIALKSIFHKKILLLLATFLFIASLIFVGISTTFALFNGNHAMVLTFQKYNVTEYPIQKTKYLCNTEYNYCSFADVSMTKADYEAVQSAFPDATIVKTESYYLPLSSFYGYNVNKQTVPNYYTFNNINQIDLINAGNQTLFPLSEGAYPSTDNEILVTDYIADLLSYFGIIPEGKDVVGSVITDMSRNLSFTITGIVKTDVSQYDNLKTANDFTSPNISAFFNDSQKYTKVYMTEAAA